MSIETVNLHLWSKCNLACVYCYGTFPARPRALGADAWRSIIDVLARDGVRRVTFSGGEPTLHPELLAIVRYARQRGLATAIITNGTRVSDDLLSALDLVGITVDSAREDTLVGLGRGRGYLAVVRDVARRTHAAGASLKVNTVVCATNAAEDLSPILRELGPWKWKPLQFTLVPGENDASAPSLTVDAATFGRFVDAHRIALDDSGIWIAPEDDATVRTTYAMIDPEGRMFQHGPDGHRLSGAVGEIGLAAALAQVGGYDRAAFLRRGGDADVRPRRLPLVSTGDGR